MQNKVAPFLRAVMASVLNFLALVPDFAKTVFKFVQSLRRPEAWVKGANDVVEAWESYIKMVCEVGIGCTQRAGCEGVSLECFTGGGPKLDRGLPTSLVRLGLAGLGVQEVSRLPDVMGLRSRKGPGVPQRDSPRRAMPTGAMLVRIRTESLQRFGPRGSTRPDSVSPNAISGEDVEPGTTTPA